MRNRGLLLETSREKFFQETRLQGALVSAGGRTDNCATGVTVGKIKERFYRFIWEIHDLKRAGLSLLFGGTTVLIHSIISFFFYSTVLGVVLNTIVTS